LSGKARRNTGISGREPGSTSGSLHGVGDLFTALTRQRLIADELVLQLVTFLRSLDLFLELIVLAPRTLTANQVRHGGNGRVIACQEPTPPGTVGPSSGGDL
jgi:hypothetical protein